MSPYITLTHKNNINFPGFIFEAPKFAMALIAVIALFVIYFSYIIYLNTSAYSLKRTETDLRSIKVEINELEGRLAAIQQLDYLKKITEKEGLVETKSIIYVRSSGGSLAVRP